jgi:hypothetical protein
VLGGTCTNMHKEQKQKGTLCSEALTFGEGRLPWIRCRTPAEAEAEAGVLANRFQ